MQRIAERSPEGVAKQHETTGLGVLIFANELMFNRVGNAPRVSLPTHIIPFRDRRDLRLKPRCVTLALNRTRLEMMMRRTVGLMSIVVVLFAFQVASAAKPRKWLPKRNVARIRR